MNLNAQCGFVGLRADPCIPPPIDRANSWINPGTEIAITSCDGHAFAMRRTGTGAPILLLHDMAATQRAWDPIRDALSWSNAVCTWDARGHGASRGTPECAVPTLDLLAADLDAAITACAPEPVVLVGHGLGALTILEYLRNYDAGHVSRVVLVDQSPCMLAGPGMASSVCSAGSAPSMRWSSRDISAATSPLPGCRCRREVIDAGSVADEAAHRGQLESRCFDLRALAPGSMLALWRSMVMRDYRVELATLQVPLLAVLGGDSNFYDAARLGEWFQSSVPDAQVIRYAMVDHAPHTSVPARFARDVAAFAARSKPVPRHPFAAGVPRSGIQARPVAARAAA